MYLSIKPFHRGKSIYFLMPPQCYPFISVIVVINTYFLRSPSSFDPSLCIYFHVHFLRSSSCTSSSSHPPSSPASAYFKIKFFEKGSTSERTVFSSPASSELLTWMRTMMRPKSPLSPYWQTRSQSSATIVGLSFEVKEIWTFFGYVKCLNGFQIKKLIHCTYTYRSGLWPKRWLWMTIKRPRSSKRATYLSDLSRSILCIPVIVPNRI